jgi:hypothetical protein
VLKINFLGCLPTRLLARMPETDRCRVGIIDDAMEEKIKTEDGSGNLVQHSIAYARYAFHVRTHTRTAQHNTQATQRIARWR